MHSKEAVSLSFAIFSVALER